MEALAAYDEVISRFGTAAELNFREEVALALLSKGMVLRSAFDRPEEALAAYDEVISRFGTAAELDFQEQVAFALLSKGRLLHNVLNRPREALAAYDRRSLASARARSQR